MALDDLIRYESAAVADMNAEKEPELAVAAMGDFYNNLLGEEDPIIKNSLQEAMYGVQRNKGISSKGLIEAIEGYGKQKYGQAFLDTKVSDLINYLTEGYSISDEVRDSLTKYNDITYLDLVKQSKNKDLSDKDKEEIGKAMTAINMLKERRFRGKTLDMINYNTEITLNSLYSKDSEKESYKQEA